MKIGEFAKLGHVSVRMLRHYDKLNLLNPAYTDHETGFRYYMDEQVADLHQIRDLQSLGFSLHEITDLMQMQSDDDRYHQLWQMQCKLQQEVMARQQQIQELQYRLSCIEGQSNSLEFTVKAVPEETIVYTRGYVPYNDFIAKQFYEVDHFLIQQHIPVKKTMGIKHYSYHNTDDYEWAFQLLDMNFQRLQVDHQLELGRRQLKGTVVASAIIHGSYFKAHPSLNGFYEWADFHGYDLCGSTREIYYRLIDRDITHPDNVMEVQFPIRRVSG